MKNKLSILLAVVAFTGWQSQAMAQTAVNLGTASNFAILGGSAITFSTGGIFITGDIGSYPTPSVVGIGNVTFVSGSDLTGTGGMAAAKSDLQAAYDSITGQSATSGVTAFVNGDTLASGVYSITSAVTDLTGTITLNGSSSDLFIFKMSSTLITGGSSQILLTGGAQASNVFWYVNTSATLGTSSVFVGNVLATTSIDLGTNSSVDGRLLAQNGAVTLGGTDTISVPTAVPEPAAVLWLAPLGAMGFVIWRRRAARSQTAA